jgi:hypothetical protein
MTYAYESLLAEHFQRLCQAILAVQYPDLQCMPVGMPDGGRDALSTDGPQGFIVFQVKFARDPISLKDPLKWLIDAIDGEAEKVKRLSGRGATQYVLVTNLSGTSHLDTGRIDKIASYLSEVLPIPTMCMWRDDLDRRLDANFDLKMRFPALLNGPDLLQLFWNALTSGEATKRREQALRAYFAHQFEQESNVRFKQAELTSTSIFDLFIDVPVNLRFGELSGRKKAPTETIQAFVDLAVRATSGPLDAHEVNYAPVSRHVYFDDSDDDAIRVIIETSPGKLHHATVGAAECFLDREFASTAKFIVLEGAPGQGKSTLTQYLAQIQRARILSKPEVSRLPASHRQSPLLLPIRIELRDLAQWFKGIDPWSPELNQPHSGTVSLEAAISAQIFRLSGGVTFEPGDLTAILSITPMLLILDGLDEVADLDDRQRVVDEVTAGVSRMNANAFDLHVLVTSRPTALSGSPYMPVDRFRSMSLTAIDPALAMTYASRWAAARNLNEKDTKEVQSILSGRLSSPHIADLAKNTMQLSILLSLIYAHGESLPDKRTELYDEYIKLFFNRESEKSESVKAHRKLLIDLHGYLGFHLHALAESDQSNGRISLSDLKRVLGDYLEREHRSRDLVDTLFLSTVERVVALVSRVEGTYEFEVQPLREFFAGRHLYDTAPYSPTGEQKPGTLPDRFDAIARSPYWTNVTRFFAGYFSKGELAGLAERLGVLVASEDFEGDAYPRTLALSILKDYVFTQSVLSTNRVVESVFDERGIRILGLSPNNSDPTAVPADRQLNEAVGGNRVAELLCGRLEEERVFTDRAQAMASLLRPNLSRPKLSSWWLSRASGRSGRPLIAWIRIGGALGVLPRLRRAHILQLFQNGSFPIDAISLLAVGSAPIDSLGEDAERAAAQAILNSPSPQSPIHPRSPLSELAILTSANTWIAMVSRNRSALSMLSRTISGSGPSDTDPGYTAIDQINQRVRSLIANGQINDLDPIRDLISLLDTAFGRTWAATEIAVIGGGVVSPKERGAGAGRLFDLSFSAADRVRNGRRRARQNRWWVEQESYIQSDLDAAFWLLTLYSWADEQVIADLIELVDQRLQVLSPDLQHPLLSATRRSSRYASSIKTLPTVPAVTLDAISPLTLTFLAPRLEQPLNLGAAVQSTKGTAYSDIAMRSFFNLALRQAGAGELTLDEFLDIATTAHEEGMSSLPRNLRPTNRFNAVFGHDWRSKVWDKVWDLPTELLALAGVRRRRRHEPILAIAESQHWLS